MIDSIMVVGVQTCCALLHLVYNLKVAQMNMQYSLIWELMLYKLELDHNAAEATKNICCVKGDGTFDHSTITKNFPQVSRTSIIRSGGPKTKDFKTVLQAIEVNSESIRQAQYFSPVRFIILRSW